MKRKKIAFPFLPLIMVVLLMVLPSVSFAALEMVLDLEGIQGESTIPNHEDEIEVLDFSWSIEMPTSTQTGSGGSTAARASFSDFCITKSLDKASVPLREKAATGGHIASATFTVIKPGENPLEYWVVEFQNLIVTKIDFKLNSTEERQTEAVCFNYGTIHWGYTPQKADGSGDATIGAGWDLEKNEQF